MALRNRKHNSSGLDLKVFIFLHIRRSSTSGGCWHWISDPVVSGLTPFSVSFPQGPRMAAITCRFKVGREKEHTSLIYLFLFRRVKIFPQSPSPGAIDFCSCLLGWSWIDPYLLTLCLSFVTCKRGLMIVPSSAQHPSKVWGDYQKVVTLRL